MKLRHLNELGMVDVAATPTLLYSYRYIQINPSTEITVTIVLRIVLHNLMISL